MHFVMKKGNKNARKRFKRKKNINSTQNLFFVRNIFKRYPAYIRPYFLFLKLDTAFIRAVLAYASIPTLEKNHFGKKSCHFFLKFYPKVFLQSTFNDTSKLYLSKLSMEAWFDYVICIYIYIRTLHESLRLHLAIVWGYYF